MMIQDLFDLSPPYRLERYHTLEAEAARLAARAGTSTERDTYIRIARDWRRLASELRETHKAPGCPDCV